MRGRALISLLTAAAFAAYSIYGLGLSYAAPKAAVVEVKPGVLTGKITDLDDKPLEGRTVKILDATGKERYSASTAKDGSYTIENLAAGTYTMIVANVQKVSLIVKADSKNTVVNAMVPAVTEPYKAGIAGLSVPLVVATLGGVALVTVGTVMIVDHDSDTFVMEPVSESD